MTPSSNDEQNGISRPAAVVWLAAGLICLLPAAQVRANDDSVRALIQQAGNTDSDEARLDYLKQLRKQPGLDASVNDDLDKLITQIERWLNEKRLDYFGGDVRRNKDFDFKIAEALRINFKGYTSEVRYTDRVLRFPSLFHSNSILGKADATIRSPDPSLLYSMVMGDPGDALYFPLNAVRWLTPPREIAVLVTESTSSRFSAELFEFGERQRSTSAEFYLLEPGQYKLTITAGDSGEQQSIETDEFVVDSRRTRVNFKLPPRKPCVLYISRL